MKTLYESLLSDFDDLSAETDEIMDTFGTAKKIFEKLKVVDPVLFYQVYKAACNKQDIYKTRNEFNLSKNECFILEKFFQHVNQLYGPMIFDTAWCLSERADWKTYEINKKLIAQVRDYLQEELNLYLAVGLRDIDQWIAGLDTNAEMSWFFCTLKEMEKPVKDAWLELMKAVERSYR